MIPEQKTMSQHHATALGALISDPRFWGSREPGQSAQRASLAPVSLLHPASQRGILRCTLPGGEMGQVIGFHTPAEGTL